jgi:hypothetical protein
MNEVMTCMNTYIRREVLKGNECVHVYECGNEWYQGPTTKKCFVSDLIKQGKIWKNMEVFREYYGNL